MGMARKVVLRVSWRLPGVHEAGQLRLPLPPRN
jgi:hypothetical protein